MTCENCDKLQSQLAATKQANEVFEASLRKQRAVLEQELAEAKERIGGVFEAIKHGDDNHLAWLQEALRCHFEGMPVPLPFGGSRKDALIESLQAQIAEYDREWEAYAKFVADSGWFNIADEMEMRLTRIRQMGGGG